MEAQGNGYGNGKHLPIIGNGFPSIHRASFSDNFVFGAASAAFQYEGAAKEGGRGPSIWDDFTKRWPGRITDGSNGNTAVDFYYQFKVHCSEFYSIMKLSGGQLNLGINKEGIRFYNELIDELIANGYVSQINHDLNGF
ncbi:hypothetical protein RHMOL_Rhmol13G0300600 [Rhododendron molle]|uniref:Uncharacterized protein n=1 Tax=Rhododendron molle TaxID=49168 RepID=A0ACC0LCQ5_RHOML|nr:hypothetical protein RHMOL_Rhmol13G0300600 [Rhododendron molle]